jgi:hypothetical protein
LPAPGFVKRVLKIRGYLRYMDDFTLFADHVAQLGGTPALGRLPGAWRASAGACRRSAA